MKFMKRENITDVWARQIAACTGALLRRPSRCLGAGGSQWQHLLSWMFPAKFQSRDCEGLRDYSFSPGPAPDSESNSLVSIRNVECT